jgi:ribosome-associated toxin RatA of RatAB toxin-antitoxin module
VVPPLVGAGVGAFSVLLARLAVQPAAALRLGAVLALAADAGWLLGSLALLTFAALPAPGAVAVALVTSAVAALAGWQALGLRAQRGDDPLADVEIVERARVLDAPPEQVWPLLTDHNLYGRLAPNLSSVDVISEPTGPLRRRCTNTGGRAWEETCTLWDDGRRFAVEVDISNYPYPLLMMRGLWQVDPHPAGSRVTMRFAYRARPTMTGGLFAIGFRPLFPPALNRIFDGWQRRLPG